jgi:hypothetical protein
VNTAAAITPPGMDILNNAYVQGGAALLFLTTLLFFLYATFRWVVRPLWEELKVARTAQAAMTERVVVIGEASRVASEKMITTLAEVDKEVISIGYKVEANGKTIEKCAERLSQIEASLNRGRR